MTFSAPRFIRSVIAIGALLLPALPVHAQDYTTGLVGHWKFDETSGTTAYDSIGTVHGTMINGLNADSNSGNGILNKALTLDGSNDHLNMANFLNMGTQDWTISAWIYIRECYSVEQGIVNKRGNNAGDDGYSLRLQCNANKPVIQAAFGAGSATTYHATGTTEISRNTWHHVAAIFDRDDTLRVYLNGSLEASLNISAENGYDVTQNTELTMGFLPGTSAYLRGSIDDVRIFNRALTGADLDSMAADKGYVCFNPNGYKAQIIYNLDENVMQYCNGTEWVAIGKGESQIPGLLAHWKLDDSIGNTVTDSSGNGYNGTWTDMNGNDLYGESVTGQVGRALNFDGDNDRISFGDVLDFDFANARTFTAWIKPDTLTATANADEILTKQRINSGFGGWGFALTESGRLRFQYISTFNTNDFTAKTDAAIITTGTWQHVAVVYDNRTALFYVDGVLVPSTVTINNIANNIDTTVPLNIGVRNNDSWSNGFTEFDGLIDDVRVYGRALTALEIDTIFKITSPVCTPPDTASLVGRWTLDETTGGVISDTSGNGNHGVWTDGVNNSVEEETVAGQDATGLGFSTDRYITVPHSASLDVSGGYTFSGWLYFDSTDSGVSPAVISKNRGGGWGDSFVIGRASAGGNVVSGKVRMTVQHGRNMHPPSSTYTNWIFPVDTWNYVTITWDGTLAKFYLSGILLHTATVTAVPDMSAGTLKIGEGVSNWSYDNFMGNMDDIRLYNRPLSETEVASLYGTIGGPCTVSSCSGPFGAKSAITYNTTHNVMQYCNGTQWIAFANAGDGGAGCTSPTGTKGTLRYNDLYNVLQYCEGDEWIAVGKKATPAGGLAHLWTFDETTGTTVYDSAGTSNGTMQSAMTAVNSTAPGKKGTSLSFNGTNKYMSLGDVTALNNASQFTLAFWILEDSFATGSTLFSKLLDNFNDVSISSHNNGIMYFAIGNGIEDSFARWIRTGLSTGVWYHTAIVFDGTQATNEERLKIYINGQQKTVSSFSGTIPAATSASLAGRPAYVGHQAGSDYLDGDMDDLRIYSSALTPAEVLTLYNSY